MSAVGSTTGVLGDFIRLKRGYDLPSQDRRPGDVPIVSSSGVTGTHNVAKVKGPGVVTGRYGTLGEVFYLERPYWPLNTALYVQDFKGNYPKFVSYFLRTLGLGKKNAAGAVPGVNRNVLHELPVDVPDLATQHRIADILSAYDDLIENNNRRMALLEEAIHLLYREWFVYLRFPGHERVEVVDGVPEGWERTTLKKVATLSYGKSLPKKVRKAGPYPVYGSSGVVGNHTEAIARGPGLIIGRKGNVGTVFLSNTDFFPIDTVYFVTPEQTSLFLYACLTSLTFVSSDAAVPGLNRNHAYSKTVLVPPSRLTDEFERFAATRWRQVQVLRTQNRLLREARDLLLPRLMNGSIPV